MLLLNLDRLLRLLSKYACVIRRVARIKPFILEYLNNEMRNLFKVIANKD